MMDFSMNHQWFIITLFQIENEKFIFQKSVKEKYDVIKTVDTIVDLIDSV